MAAADLSRELLSSNTTLLTEEGSRSLAAIVRDATPALSQEAAASGSEPALRASTAGAAGVLLHVSHGDDPQSAHHRLRALLACMGAGVKVRRLWPHSSPEEPHTHCKAHWHACMQVPLLLLSSSPVLRCEDLAAWMGGLLAGDGVLSNHVGAHCVRHLPAAPSAEASAQLLSGLEWLAQQAPAQPKLQVLHGSPACDSCYHVPHKGLLQRMHPPRAVCATFPGHYCTGADAAGADRWQACLSLFPWPAGGGLQCCAGGSRGAHRGCGLVASGCVGLATCRVRGWQHTSRVA